MAVAAHEGRAYLYLLKTMEDLEKELETSSDIEPVKEVGVSFTSESV